MDDVNRRQAIKAAAVGAVATGAVALGGSDAKAQDREKAGQKKVVIKGGASRPKTQDEEPTPEETTAFNELSVRNRRNTRTGRLSFDIPYADTIGSVNIAGIFHLQDPEEDSTTDGVVFGAINGTYTLDRGNASARFYDPSGALLRLDLVIHFVEKFAEARLCIRKYTGGWACGSWKVIATW